MEKKVKRSADLPVLPQVNTDVCTAIAENQYKNDPLLADVLLPKYIRMFICKVAECLR